MNDVRVSARMALKSTGTTKAPPAKLRYRYFLGVKWFRTPPSVGPMLAMKRFSWHYTFVTSFEDGPGNHRCIHRHQRAGIDPERGAGLFERLRRHSITLLTRAGGS
jgi:hypothetical protein